MKLLLGTTQHAILFLLSLPVVAGCNGATDFLAESQQAGLHRADSCDDLLERVREDARQKLALSVESQKAWFDEQLVQGLVVELGSADAALESLDGGEVVGVGPGRAANADASPDEHSETTTQVEGVDEADIVKTDGERIYLLHGRGLYLFDAWPADATQLLGSAEVEGTPFELFVDRGKAIVFSSTSAADVPQVPGRRPTHATGCYRCSEQSFTQVSVYDVRGNAPVLEREILVEGTYVSGRRHGSIVRVVVTNGAATVSALHEIVPTWSSGGGFKSKGEFLQDLERWRKGVLATIEASELSLWLPRRYERVEGRLKQLSTDCSSYFIPEAASVGEGATEVVTFDLQSPERAPEGVTILGGATTVYASEDTLVLGHPNYAWTLGRAERSRTALHMFTLDESTTTYESSGFVPGYLHNQFSIDEKDGVLRVSTTETLAVRDGGWSRETENRVFTLAPRGKHLEVLGKTEPFGDPGETIYATRFLGDRAYVVTFLEVDPLVAIDLSDPTAPRVLGDLHIPGFSEYIHPLPKDHLLTIGQDGEGGVALQIFDVTKPMQPSLVHKQPFPSAYSEAGRNQKAFTFMQDKFGEDLSLLMFPITSYDDQTSTLSIFAVSAKDGFVELGTINHTELLTQNCPPSRQAGDGTCYYDGTEMRRGLEIGGEAGDFVYAISLGGLSVHDLADLAETVLEIPLPTPDLSDYYY